VRSSEADAMRCPSGEDATGRKNRPFPHVPELPFPLLADELTAPSFKINSGGAPCHGRFEILANGSPMTTNLLCAATISTEMIMLVKQDLHSDQMQDLREYLRTIEQVEYAWQFEIPSLISLRLLMKLYDDSSWVCTGRC
jgi:hypothetical protein